MGSPEMGRHAFVPASEAPTEVIDVAAIQAQLQAEQSEPARAFTAPSGFAEADTNFIDTRELQNRPRTAALGKDALQSANPNNPINMPPRPVDPNAFRMPPRSPREHPNSFSILPDTAPPVIPRGPKRIDQIPGPQMINYNRTKNLDGSTTYQGSDGSTFTKKPLPPHLR